MGERPPLDPCRTREFPGNAGMAPWECGNGILGSFPNLGIPWECGNNPWGFRNGPPRSFPNLGIPREWGMTPTGSFPSWEILRNDPTGMQEWQPWILPKPGNSSGTQERGFGNSPPQIPKTGIWDFPAGYSPGQDLPSPNPPGKRPQIPKIDQNPFFFTANSPSAAPGEMGRSKNPWKNPGESLKTARREREWRGAEPGSAPEGTSRFQHSDLARRELGTREFRLIPGQTIRQKEKTPNSQEKNSFGTPLVIPEMSPGWARAGSPGMLLGWDLGMLLGWDPGSLRMLEGWEGGNPENCSTQRRENQQKMGILGKMGAQGKNQALAAAP